MKTDRSRWLPLLACFWLSGLAGLIYETAWTQQFAIVFGTSELAVATVLAAYMAGLTAGAVLAGRWVERLSRPVATYAVLELGIALAALAVPAALRLTGRLQVLLLGGLDVPPDAMSLPSALFYLASAFAVLFVPTALMGATLPVLIRHAVTRDLEIGPRAGLLYTANTIGAATGTLAAAFLLLPRLGLGQTVLVAAGINVLVFLVAALALRERRPGSAAAAEATGTPSPPTSRARGFHPILVLMLVSGFVSFSWEVLWTRLLSHLLGSGIHAFGTMLATFLAGIGLGSAGASRWASSPRRAYVGFAVAQLGVALCSFAAFASVDRLPGRLDGAASLLEGAGLAAATLLPSALFLGATFPLAVRVLADDASRAARASARVYAWNTCGAIAGAVATGFFLLPNLRIAGTATAAVATSLVLSLATLGLARPLQKSPPTPQGAPQARSRWLAASAVAGLSFLAVWPPRTPWQVLRTTPLSATPATGKVVFYGVGRSSTVLLFEEWNSWRLTTNGLPESAIQPKGAGVGQYAVSNWLSLLPIASRPEAETMLIVGLGAGLTLNAVPESVREIHLVELEPEVIRANRSLASKRRRDPLADPRLSIHVNDARGALALTDRRFDVVVSQPSHPWTAGASNLFTREFFALVRERLEPDGVFLQWIGLRFVDEPLLRGLLATLADVFPHVDVYAPYPGGALLFLAGLEPLDVERNVERGLAAGRDRWRRLGVTAPEEILVSRVLGDDGVRALAAGAAPITDSRNLFKTDSRRALRDPLTHRGADRLFASFDPITAPEPRAAAERPLLLARLLLRYGAVERARRLAATYQDPFDRQAAFALAEFAAGRPRQARRSLTSVVLNTTDRASEAFHVLLVMNRRALEEVPVPAAVRARLDRDSSAAAVVEGWRLVRAADFQALRRLEPALAGIDVRHALHQSAAELRVAWRQASGEPALAREALELLDLILARAPGARLKLIQRARLALLAGDTPTCLASLSEIVPALEHRPKPGLVRGTAAIFRSLPPEAREDARYARLEAELSQLSQLAAEPRIRTRPQGTRAAEEGELE